jgi:hypothetical protein
MVANFKRRVPPRLPKPRKRDLDAQPPRSAIGHAPSLPHPPAQDNKTLGRARSFTTPGSFSQSNGTGPGQWNATHGGAPSIKPPLPPLLVPEPLSQQPYAQHHPIHPITPTDEPQSQYNGPFTYSAPPPRDPIIHPQQYGYTDQSNWPTSTGGHSGSLSSLLNPSSSHGQHQGRPTPMIDTSYSAPSFFLQAEHSASSISPDSRPNTGYSIPDSRPNTGYSVTSVSSLPPYDDQMNDYSRPGSSHVPLSPIRPTSSKSAYGSSLSIRRNSRRHSQALNPYPSPYSSYNYEDQQRPSTSPAPFDHSSSGISRVRSMVQLPSLEPYGFTSQAEFAYNPVSADSGVDGQSSVQSQSPFQHQYQQQVQQPASQGGWSQRPSTSTSTISQASSQVRTPDQYPQDTQLHRREYFKFIALPLRWLTL